ncbi:maleylacetoacetate isomerase [Suttonella sp. R2A3]|nr:maleylacetoacetate isomerase [Suttonella sp. R2A3]UJF24213.1 maleylacetoacetate isomerase [Suttonella sp. R2A3]
MSPALYGYWRSSASYRVRIALALKGIDYHYQTVHLVRGGGEQHQKHFREINPQGLIPVYQDEHGVFSQSQAIIDYLELRHPEPALLPEDPAKQAHVRALAQIIACEIHPLDNLKVLTYLTSEFGISDEQKTAWYQHWIAEGFTALEAQIGNVLRGMTFSLGREPGYLEAFIIPQMYNARRFNCPLTIIRSCSL